MENMCAFFMSGQTSQRAEVKGLKEMLILQNAEVTAKIQKVDSKVDEMKKELGRQIKNANA